MGLVSPVLNRISYKMNLEWTGLKGVLKGIFIFNYPNFSVDCCKDYKGLKNRSQSVIESWNVPLEEWRDKIIFPLSQ